MRRARDFAGWLEDSLGDQWAVEALGVDEDGYAHFRLSHPGRKEPLELLQLGTELGDRLAAARAAGRVLAIGA